MLINRTLKIGYTKLKYNPKLDHLPKGLTRLITNDTFNRPVNNLPPCLEVLIFGRCFNQPVDSLPVSLCELSFGYNFNHPINRYHSYYKIYCYTTNFFNSSLPKGLKKLSVGGHFSQPISSLPPYLTHFEMEGSYKYNLSHLPSTLVSFKSNSPNIPEAVLKQLSNRSSYPFLVHFEIPQPINDEYI